MSLFCSGRTNGAGGAEVAADIAKRNNGTTLEMLIEKEFKKKNMYSIDEMKQVLLKSDFEKFNEMLKSYNVNEFDKFGNNILHFYIKERGRINIDYKNYIDLLIDNGLDIEGKSSNKYVFGTVLQLAVSVNQKDIFDYLIDLGANVDATNSYGNSILSTAIMNYFDNDGYYIKKLIEHGANVYQKNNKGISPISLVYSFDNNDAKKFFPPLSKNNNI